jgi:hypothetical protein
MRNSDHDHWKAKIEATITPVCTRGNMIVKKIWNLPAPSIRADSSKDVGIVEKNWRKRKMMNGIPLVDEPYFRHRHVEGHDGDHGGYHERGKHEEEQGPCLADLEPGEGIPRKAAAHDSGNTIEKRKNDAVDEVLAEVHHGPCEAVVLPYQGLGEHTCWNPVQLVHALQGGHQHAHEGKKDDEYQQGKNEEAQPRRKPLPSVH